MKTKIAVLSLALALITLVSSAQTLEKQTDSSFKKNLIGIQYNPVWGPGYFNGNLYSARYGYKFIRSLTVGAELSWNFPNGSTYPNNIVWQDPDFIPDNYYGMSTNIFFRFSYPSDKRIQGFVEVSPYAHLYFEKPFNYHDVDFFIYVAPGVSLFSKNRKFSMDLYYKISTQNFNNTHHGQLNYKLNFHF